MLIDHNGRFTASFAELLHGVSAVDRRLLDRAMILPHTANWLHFPWYPAQRGGAFVLGSRIYLKTRSYHGAQLLGGPEHEAAMLLLAHEVGHLPQAERFGLRAIGRFRFVCWAAGQYIWSAARHGIHAHDNAQLEREADEGRWVLSELMKVTSNGNSDHPITGLIRSDQPALMTKWLASQQACIEDLQMQYRKRYLR